MILSFNAYKNNAYKNLLCSATTRGTHALPIKTLNGDFPTHFPSQPEFACSLKHVAAPSAAAYLLPHNQFITSSYLFV